MPIEDAIVWCLVSNCLTYAIAYLFGYLHGKDHP